MQSNQQGGLLWTRVPKYAKIVKSAVFVSVACACWKIRICA